MILCRGHKGVEEEVVGNVVAAAPLGICRCTPSFCCP